MLLTDSFLEYLKYERNYSDKTVVSYGTDLREFDEFLRKECQREVSPQEVDASLIREWMMSLMEKDVKATSVNRKLSALRSFYKFLLKRNMVTVDPTRKVTGRFYLCGDGKSDVDQDIGLTAPRVMLCAAHQALTVIRLILGEKDV